MAEATIRDLAKITTDRLRLLVFLGGKSDFPQQLLRLIEAEFDDIELLRVSPRELKELALAPQASCLLFDDEAAACKLAAEEDCAARPSFQREIYAYRDIDQARQLLIMTLRHPRARRLRFLPLHLPLSSFVALLHILLAGDNMVPEELILAADLGPDPKPSAAPPDAAPLAQVAPAAPCNIHLTPRELDVLRLAAHGQSNKHIARTLNLSEHTIKLHIHHLITKIGASNRTEAAHWLRQQSALASSPVKGGGGDGGAH